MNFKNDKEIASLVENLVFQDPTKTDAAIFLRFLNEAVEEVLNEAASGVNQDIVDKVLAALKKHPDYGKAEIQSVKGATSNPPYRVEITNLGGDKMRDKIAKVLQAAGLQDVKYIDRKNTNVGGQHFTWIQGGGTADAKDPMCGNPATCFENNIIWGIKYFVDPAKALEFFNPDRGTGTIFGDCVDDTGKFDPSKKGCAGNYIIKDDIDAGKKVAETLKASVEKFGSLVDAGEVSGQTFEITKGYSDSGVVSGEPKTDISITTEKDGEKKVWNCSVKEANKTKDGYESGGQFASAQGNELAAIVKTSINRINKNDPEILKTALEEANLGPEQVGNMLQAVMARTTVYKARKALLQTGGEGLQSAEKAGVTGKGQDYEQKELEEDVLPYPTIKREELWEEDDSAQDHTAGVDVEKYRGEVDAASDAGKLQDPSWKSGSSEREFESEFSQAQRSVLGKSMSYAMGFDDAVQLSDQDMQPLVQETKDSFGSLLDSSADTKKLRDDILKEIFATPLPVPEDMVIGQARFDAAKANQPWEELKSPERKKLLKAAKEKLVIVAQVKLAESIREGLEAFQEANVEGMRKLMQNRQLRIEMLREAVTGVGKFKEGKDSPAVPNAVVTWNRDGYASFVSLEGEEREGAFDPDAWYKDNVDNIRIELRDRGTGRGFAGRVEKHDAASLRGRKDESWEAFNDSILLEDFMRAMGAGNILVLEENLKLLDFNLLTEEMILEAMSWSDVKAWTKDKLDKGAEKGKELLGKVKDFGREILAGAKAALQKAIAAAKQFYAQMKKMFSKFVTKLSAGVKGILSKDPIEGIVDITGLVPVVDTSKIEV